MGKRNALLADDFDYPKTFDRIMGEHFGEKFSTEWSLFAGTFGGYVTVRENGRKLTKRQAMVGRSISDAISAARPTNDR